MHVGCEWQVVRLRQVSVKVRLRFSNECEFVWAWYLELENWINVVLASINYVCIFIKYPLLCSRNLLSKLWKWVYTRVNYFIWEGQISISESTHSTFKCIFHSLRAQNNCLYSKASLSARASLRAKLNGCRRYAITPTIYTKGCLPQGRCDGKISCFPRNWLHNVICGHPRVRYSIITL